MIKKIFTTIAQVIAIIGLCVLIFFGFKMYNKLKDLSTKTLELDKMYREHPVQVVSVVRSELKTLYPYMDSLIQAAGLNEKHVEKITNIYHEYKYDTIPAIIIPDSGRQILTVAMQKDCFKADGIIDFSNTGIKLTDDEISKLRFHLTGVTLTDTTTTVYYFSRKIKKIFFLPLRIGRKQYFSETFSKCNAKTQTESINLIKR